MERQSTTELACAKRAFAIRTGIISALALASVPLALCLGAALRPVLAGVIAGIVAGIIGALITSRAVSGNLFGAPSSQPLVAIALVALTRVTLLGATMAVLASSGSQVMPAGIAFLILFAIFRTSETLFMGRADALDARAATEGDSATTQPGAVPESSIDPESRSSAVPESGEGSAPSTGAEETVS